MSQRRSHSQIQELLGAYALDAVDPDEAELVELHLRECPRCRAEVADHRETAALLAAGQPPAPAALWDSIVSGLEEPAPPLDLTRYRERRQSRAATWFRAATAVAAALVIVGLGVTVIDQGRKLEDVQAAVQSRGLMAAALAASSHPEAKRTALRSPDGVVLAHAVVTPDGSGFLWSDALAPLDADRTYQLWAVIGSRTISAGLLGEHPDVVAFQAAGPVMALAITNEVSGGVVQTENDPLASGLLAT